MRRLHLVLATAFAAATVSGCTAPDTAYRTLESSGYTDIQLTGYKPFSCSKDDTFSTGFVAKNPRGQVVEGTVCSGWLKNGTVRF